MEKRIKEQKTVSEFVLKKKEQFKQNIGESCEKKVKH